MRSPISNQPAGYRERTGDYVDLDVDTKRRHAVTEPARPVESMSPGRSVTIADWLNISHELRTPANAILGHVELLISGAMGSLSSDIRASLGDIQRAGQDLKAQIAKAIETGQDLSCSTPFPPEIIALMDQLGRAWSQAQLPIATVASPSHQTSNEHRPTCWLQVIAFVLYDLGATPTGETSRSKSLCDIDHTYPTELRFDLCNADRPTCSISVGIIKTAIGMTGGELKHSPDQLVVFWPTQNCQ